MDMLGPRRDEYAEALEMSFSEKLISLELLIPSAAVRIRLRAFSVARREFEYTVKEKKSIPAGELSKVTHVDPCRRKT